MTSVLASCLANRGVKVLMYLDDWSVSAPSEGDAIMTLDVVLEEMKRMVFLVNHQKSVLNPTQTLDCLGTYWFTQSASYRLSMDNIRRILS